MMKARYLGGVLIFALLFGMSAFAADGIDETQQGQGEMQAPGMSTPSWGSMQSVGAVNINTASADQLKMLPGIDDKLARSIVDYRDSNGPFKSTDDLLNVKGMTKEKFNKISPNLALEGETTYQPGMTK